MAKKDTRSTPQSILIIGASRGIGFELVRQYREAGHSVTATVRRKADVKKVDALGAKTIVFDAVKSPLAAVNRAAGHADIVIFNAGVLGDRGKVGDRHSAAIFDQVMRTNVYAPLRFMSAVAGKLAKRGAKLAVLSSIMGSKHHMATSGAVVYRASKAAVNMVARATALEFGPQGLIVLALHPGWVRTDMGGSDADIDVETSVRGLTRVIARAKLADSGLYFDYTGKKLAW
ncbi:MAG: SDR family NAD(P)-dependent oxidoreductase [Betaproteobacteria bacterium]|nr:SDR family NAD(P)-dependent oxidoreductase [Betaproteobacteria bacterium]